MTIINSTYANNNLIGTDSFDFIDGGSGDDNIQGLGGDDYIYGQAGVNTLNGGDGSDTFYIKSGSRNILIGGTGFDILGISYIGGLDNSRSLNTYVSFNINLNNDTTWVGLPDIISSTGMEALQRFFSGAGSDVIEANATSNINYSIYGNAGNDTLRGGGGFDVLDGGDGNDILEGRDGGDILNAGAGTNTLDGGNGDDTFSTILGATSSNRLIGGAGYDAISAWDVTTLTTSLTLNLNRESTWVGKQGILSSTGVEAVERFYSGAGNDLIEADATSGTNHSIYGNAGNDTLRGGTRTDLLDGGDGNDILEGRDGFDVLVGGAGINTLDGGNGDDTFSTIFGATSSNRLIGGAGYDEISSWDVTTLTTSLTLNLNQESTWVGKQGIISSAGVEAVQRFYSGAGNDLIEANATSGVNHSIYGNGGNDTLRGGARVDLLDGGDGNDILEGRDGFDVLVGGAGTNTLDGGNGDDTFSTILGATSSNRLIGGAGYDAISSWDVTTLTTSLTLNLNRESTWVGKQGILSSTGVEAVERFYSGAGNDVIEADATSNTYHSIYGNAGNDTLRGGTRTDLLDGGDGNDILEGRDGFDVLVGGAGINTLDGGNGDDTFSTILGATSSNRLIGGAGYDILSAWDVTTLTTSLTLNLNRESTWVGKQGILSSTGVEAVERFYSGAGNDVIEADATSNSYHSIYGNAGNDTLRGGTRTDLLDGGDGNDILEGRDGFDVLVGGAGINTLDGGNGDDTFSTILGATSSNRLIGGAGYDILSVWDFSHLTTNVSLNVDVDTSWAGVAGVISSTGIETVETVYSGSGNDTITAELSSKVNHTIYGNGGMDSITGGDGIDRVYGGDGNDRVIGSTGDDFVYGGSGDDILDGDLTAGYAKADGNDRLDGGDGNDTLYGFGGNDDIIGGAGNDYLLSGTGIDWLDGGDGDDIYVIYEAYDVVTGDSSGYDRLQTHATYILPTVIEEMTLIGAANINGTGNGGNNLINGNSGNNILDGTGGIDRLNGGLGDDTYIIDTLTDTITELVNQGTDKIQSNLSFNLTTVNNIENLLLTGTNAINATGNAGNNALTGNNSNNILDGGAGVDTLSGSLGNDTYIVDSTTDIIIELANQGTDTILSSISFSLATLPNIENITLTGTSAINATGNTGDNILTGNIAANTLTGGLGNDTYIINSSIDTIVELANQGTDTIQSSISFGLTTLPNIENITLTGTSAINATGNAGDNILTGNIAANTLTGGLGNDTYTIDSTADTIIEIANQGNDTIQSSITFSLATLPNIENITLTGTSAINATGNGGDNILTGNVAANTLTGGLGNDTYIIDSTADTIIELANQGNDTIQSSISFSLTTLPNIENITLIGTSAINATGNTTNNILTGNSANNILDGGAGIDTLVGGLGNDTYIVDSTTDIITELVNQGIDTIQSSISFSLTTLPNIENLTLSGTSAINATGNAGDNILTGNIAANTLTGGLGNDTYIINSTIDTIIELASQGNDTIQSSISFSLMTLPNIENITLTGTSAINATGNATNNILTGNSVNNTLDGSAGIDRLVGGLGNDIYIIDSTTDTITELVSQGNDTIQSSITFSLTTLANIENITLTGTSAINATGNAGDNILTGNIANNILTGGLGIDTLVGGLGDDTYIVDSTTDTITELANQGTDTILSTVGLSISALVNVENVTLSNNIANDIIGNTANNILIGNIANNTIDGGAGNDTINAGTGNDNVIGGTGDDLLVIDYSNSLSSSISYGIRYINIVDNGANGYSGVFYNGYAWVINTNEINFSEIERFNITGTVDDDSMIGGKNSDILKGNAGDDYIISGGGNDTIDGGIGIDRLELNLADRTVNLTIDLTTGNFTTAGVTVTNIEEFGQLITGSGNDSIVASILNDTINTGGGNDTINAGTGNDTINAGTGNDTINTGLGQDNAIGGSGDDLLIIDYRNSNSSYGISYSIDDDGANGYSGKYYQGYFSLYTDNEVNFSEIERFNLTGSVNDDSLIGGKNSDTLQGGGGNDNLTGGNGNDSYQFNANSNLGIDTINEDINGGIDTFDFSSTSTDINIDLAETAQQFVTNNLNLVIPVISIENIIGGSGNDLLAGNILANEIQGKAGNDLIYGDGGNDRFSYQGAALTGMNTLNSLFGKDTILDFTSGQDKLVLSKATFTAITNNGATLTSFISVANDTLVAAQTASIVFSQSSNKVFYNQNGAGAGFGTNGGELLTLTDITSLGANDFIIN